MTKILAIDASTEACSVALAVGDDIHQRYQVAPRKHCELILPMVDELLHEASIKLLDLDAIAVTLGPGAFTGVRISIGVVQGLAFSANLPVIGISTLEVLAYGAACAVKKTEQNDKSTEQPVRVAVAMDARMDEVYWGCYEVSGENLRSLVKEGVFPPHNVTLPTLSVDEKTIDESWQVAGSGWTVYKTALEQSTGHSLSDKVNVQLPRASWLLSLAKQSQQQAEDVMNLQPLYLRDKVASTIKERLSGKSA